MLNASLKCTSKVNGVSPSCSAGSALKYAVSPSATSRVDTGSAALAAPTCASTASTVPSAVDTMCCDCFIGRLPRWEDPLAQVTFAPTFAGRRSTRFYRTKLVREILIDIHKIQMYVLLLLRILNDFDG